MNILRLLRATQRKYGNGTIYLCALLLAYVVYRFLNSRQKQNKLLKPSGTAPFAPDKSDSEAKAVVKLRPDFVLESVVVVQWSTVVSEADLKCLIWLGELSKLIVVAQVQSDLEHDMVVEALAAAHVSVPKHRVLTYQTQTGIQSMCRQLKPKLLVGWCCHTITALAPFVPVIVAVDKGDSCSKDLAGNVKLFSGLADAMPTV
eukprot:TRINITY_DN89329_c0_g1_i1.p1 TRINITY_DN89329_c0_g1~~TRINITY_DN89329_c0_g1_i1.p1  ORF type:complete len:226 (+),score=20.71 TRINITY_DN89329_c0_g1_i1:72-680(+)